MSAELICQGNLILETEGKINLLVTLYDGFLHKARCP